jgi:hypothetical protein
VLFQKCDSGVLTNSFKAIVMKSQPEKTNLKFNFFIDYVLSHETLYTNGVFSELYAAIYRVSSIKALKNQITKLKIEAAEIAGSVPNCKKLSEDLFLFESKFCAKTDSFGYDLHQLNEFLILFCLQFIRINENVEKSTRSIIHEFLKSSLTESSPDKETALPKNLMSSIYEILFQSSFYADYAEKDFYVALAGDDPHSESKINGILLRLTQEIEKSIAANKYYVTEKSIFPSNDAKNDSFDLFQEQIDSDEKFLRCANDILNPKKFEKVLSQCSIFTSVCSEIGELKIQDSAP